MINGIIQIRSRIFESGLFYKAVQLLGIPQVPFGIDNTLDFFSERKKLCVRIGQYLFQCLCHSGEPHTFQFITDFIILYGK